LINLYKAMGGGWIVMADAITADTGTSAAVEKKNSK